MNRLQQKRWNAYAVGAGIGLLETLAMATAKRPLGITSVFEQGAAQTLRWLDPKGAARHAEAGGETPELSWESTLVGGVLLGSALSATLSGDRCRQAVPQRWRESVGTGTWTRQGAAALGGAVMMFGARMAKGCTSGHGISGNMQLAASSGLFSAVMFTSAGLVARAIFGRQR